MDKSVTENLRESEASHPQQLRSMEFVQESIRTEVKEIKRRQKIARIRSLTDTTLMLLTILITVLAYLWLTDK
jgi:hypothetical protein